MSGDIPSIVSLAQSDGKVFVMFVNVSLTLDLVKYVLPAFLFNATLQPSKSFEFAPSKFVPLECISPQLLLEYLYTLVLPLLLLSYGAPIATISPSKV